MRSLSPTVNLTLPSPPLNHIPENFFHHSTLSVPAVLPAFMSAGQCRWGQTGTTDKGNVEEERGKEWEGQGETDLSQKTENNEGHKTPPAALWQQAQGEAAQSCLQVQQNPDSSFLSYKDQSSRRNHDLYCSQLMVFALPGHKSNWLSWGHGAHGEHGGKSSGKPPKTHWWDW